MAKRISKANGKGGVTLDKIGATKLPERTVDVPEWGGEVVVRGLSAGDVYDGEALTGIHAVARNVKRSVFHPTGEAVFGDVALEKIIEIMKGSAVRPWDAIIDAMADINGWTERARKRMREGFFEADASA